MTGAARVRTMLRRLGVQESAFIALCREAGHAAGRIEDLPALGSDPFDRHYSVREVAERLGFCERTIRRRIASGEFGPPEHLVLDHETRIPWSSVERYLRAHRRQSIRLDVGAVEERIEGGVSPRGKFKAKAKP